jgi:hypothetical protein
MTADSNLHNTDEYIIEDNEVGSGLAEEERRPGISPGSSGELTFYVIPKQKDELTVQFTLELEAYTEVDQNTKDAIEVTLTSDTTLGKDNQTWIKQVDEEHAALKLLEGHLMFFKTRTGSEESGYYYSDQLFDWSFERTLTAEELEAGEPVEITIYWAWPYVLGQAILPTSAYQLNGTTLFDTTSEDANAPRKLLYNQMIKYPTFYFYDATDTELTGLSVATLSKIYDADYTQEEYSKISRYYNAADQYIGDNIRYIFVRLSAQS